MSLATRRLWRGTRRPNGDVRKRVRKETKAAMVAMIRTKFPESGQVESLHLPEPRRVGMTRRVTVTMMGTSIQVVEKMATIRKKKSKKSKAKHGAGSEGEGSDEDDGGEEESESDEEDSVDSDDVMNVNRSKVEQAGIHMSKKVKEQLKAQEWEKKRDDIQRHGKNEQSRKDLKRLEEVRKRREEEAGAEPAAPVITEAGSDLKEKYEQALKEMAPRSRRRNKT